MLADAYDHVKIAHPAPAQPGIAFARYPNPLPVARARLDANFQRIGPLDATLAVAHRARRKILSRPMAPRTGDVELHPAARLLDRSRSMTRRTLPGSLDEAVAMAVPAHVAPRDIQLHHPAADRRPERHIDLIFQIAARFRPFLRRFASPPASENTGKNVFEPAARSARCFPTASASPFKQIGKIKSAEIDVARSSWLATASRKASTKSARPRPRLSAAARVSVRRRRIDVVRVKPQLVVNLPLLRIAENVIRFGKRLELFFRGFVARIDVRMILTRQFAERLANVVDRRRLLHAKYAVIIFVFGLSGHRLSASYHNSVRPFNPELP